MSLKRWGMVAVLVIATVIPLTAADAAPGGGTENTTVSEPSVVDQAMNWFGGKAAWLRAKFSSTPEAAPPPAPAASTPPPRVVSLPIGRQASPPQTVASAPAPAAKRSTYTVKRGDILSGRFGREDGKEVCELNKELGKLKNCNMLSIGQVLDLPDGVEAKAKMLKVKAPARKAETTPTTKSSMNESGEIRYASVGRAPLLGCGKKDIDTINREAWKALGLSEEDQVYLRLHIDQRGPRINITSEEGLVRILPGERLEQVTFCRKGKAMARGPMRTAWSKDVPVYGERFVLPSSRAIVWMRNCYNWISWTPPVVQAPPVVEAPPPEVIVPPPVVEVPVVPSTPLSVIPKARDAAEWEVIVGAGVWDNNLAHGNWQYGEGMLSAILPDGYRVGAGVYGQWGSGESETSAYSWREKGYGPQIGVKRNFLTTQTDQFGQQTLMPAGWGLKLRFLRDSVSGSNPDSGYSMSQTGRKVGLYAEYMERKSPDWMVGVNGEVWNFGSGKITSTWSGDTPQDRGSWNANVWAQYRHSDDWQTRGIAGVAHQNWDQLNLFRVAGELRYKETFMCGPSVSFALNKPAAYSGVSKSDLTTKGFGCRAEFGGIIRTLHREQQEAGVVYVGPVEAQAP